MISNSIYKALSSLHFIVTDFFQHSKNIGVKLYPERVHWGQTPFRVNDDPEISQLEEEYDPDLGQRDPIICQVCRKLTYFRVIADLEWSLARMDPFPGHGDPGVLRVNPCTPPPTPTDSGGSLPMLIPHHLEGISSSVLSVFFTDNC